VFIFLLEIKLPSDVYTFEVVNTTVATYDRKTSMITTLAYGETKVILISLLSRARSVFI
jgi:hypothetical protein